MARVRQKVSDRYREIAGKMAEEAGVKEVVEDRKGLCGFAYVKTKKIHVPSPNTLRRLYVFAHECGHVALEHGPEKTKHRVEYEAETWAVEAFGRYGLTTHPKSDERGRQYVAYKIRQALRRGAKSIDPEAREFARGFLAHRDEVRLRLLTTN